MKTAPAKTVVARVLLLKRVAMLAHLSPAALTSLAERVDERVFAPGGQLLADGDAPARLHFVLRGEAEVGRRGRRLGICGECDVVGDIDVLAAAPSARLDVRAATATQTLSIDRPGWLAAQEDCFPLQRAMLKRIGGADVQARRRLGWSRVYDRRGVDAVATQALDDGAERFELAHRVLCLRATRELRGLRIRTLGRLAGAAEIVPVPAGGPIWCHGDVADFAVQVLRGSLECRGADGPSVSVGSEALLGLPEVLAEGVRWYDVSAASEVVTMRFAAEDILDELEDDTDVAVELMTALAADVAKLEDLSAGAGADGGSGAS